MVYHVEYLVGVLASNESPTLHVYVSLLVNCEDIVQSVSHPINSEDPGVTKNSSRCSRLACCKELDRGSKCRRSIRHSVLAWIYGGEVPRARKGPSCNTIDLGEAII